MAEKKITIVEQYARIIAKAEKGEPLTAEDIEFLQERADQVAKKNANRKPTKEQEANAEIKKEILDCMQEGVQYTITDIMKAVPSCNGLANQKVSALVRQLREAELVDRTEIKGRAFFTKN